MPSIRPRLTISRLMTAVGGVAITLSVARWSPAVGTILGVTVFLAFRRAFGAIDQAEAIGATISPSRKAYEVVASFPVVALLLLITASVFLLVLAATAAVAGAALTFIMFAPGTPWPVQVVLWVALLAPATFAGWKTAALLGGPVWPYDLSGPEDGIWFLPDPLPGTPPEGRVEAAPPAERLDGRAEPTRVPGITGGRAEVGEP